MTTPTFRFWTDGDISALPPVPWLIARVLQTTGLGVLYGKSGAGKSFVALSLAVAVALDREWLGRSVQGGHVVYLAAEGGRTIGPRLAALKDWYGVETVPRLTIVPDAVYLHHGAHLAAYLAQLRAKVPGVIALTAIDTLSRCSAGSDENSNADRELTVEGLNHIRTATEGAILAVHHTGWNEDRMRGGYALQAAADTILALKGVEGGVELKVEKQRDDEDGEAIALQLKPCLDSLIVEGANYSIGVTEPQRRLLRVLDDIALSDGVSTTAWLQSANMPASSFYASRKRLVADGYAMALARGRYVVSPTGRDLLQLQSNSKGLQNGVRTTPLHSPPFRGAGVGVPESGVGDVARGDAWKPEEEK